jgi:hypothetical protein
VRCLDHHAYLAVLARDLDIKLVTLDAGLRI